MSIVLHTFSLWCSRVRTVLQYAMTDKVKQRRYLGNVLRLYAHDAIATYRQVLCCFLPNCVQMKAIHFLFVCQQRHLENRLCSP